MSLVQQTRLPVPCTYSGCGHSFRTQAEMRGHKIEDPEHFYCKKCDLDCESWADLTQHKIDLMAPFLEGRMKGMGEHPKHIVCEFCGEDFRSFGGRKKHRETMHQAEQLITCPGCESLYVRASQMIDHLERNECSEISAYDFRVNIQKKYIISEVLESPDALVDNLERLGRSITTQSKPATMISDNVSTTAKDSDSDDDDGGVALGGDKRGSQAVMPVPQLRQNLEKWPRLPGLGPAPKSLTESFAKASLGPASPSISTFELPPSRVTNKSHQYLKDTESVTTSKTTNAWGKELGSKALFPHAKPTPPTAETLAMIEKADTQMDQSKNLFSLDFCNYRSDAFDPERFFDHAIEKYTCPFSACRGMTFEDNKSLRDHFYWGHTKIRFPCPACCKVFRKPSALVAHIESTTTCRIQKADEFKKLVDDISGGFLKAKTLPQPAIYRPSTDLVVAGKPSNGVMSAQFKAKLPSSFREPSW